MQRLILALVFLCGLIGSANATINSCQSFGLDGGAGVSICPQSGAASGSAVLPTFLTKPEIAGLDYPNNGTTAAYSGAAGPLTLTVTPGTYTGTILSRAYCWHTVSNPCPGGSLGTGTQVVINTATTPSIVGQAIQIDEIVSNLAGSLTTTSYWFGTIENGAPTQPVPSYETTMPSSISLPTAPQHFLECYGPGTYQHAVYPGNAIPPCAPNLASGHVWVIDPVHGRTQDAGASGHPGDPFNSLQAVFNTGVTGYSGGALWARTISPGDTIQLECGTTGSPLGALVAPAAAYSTSDGTSSGTTVYTYIMGDPASGCVPMLQPSEFEDGVIGFIIYGFNLEPTVAGYTGGGWVVQPGSGTTARDVHIENNNVAGIVGRSSDPWFPSHYPQGGSSNGLIDTAGTGFPQGGGETPAPSITLGASLAANSQSIPTTTVPGLGAYLWSPQYYSTTNWVSTLPHPPANGVPNGTVMIGQNGVDRPNYINNGLSVTAVLASALTSNTLRGSTTNNETLPNNGDLSGYWLFATSTTVPQQVLTWSTNVFSAWFTTNFSVGDTFCADATTSGDPTCAGGQVFTAVASGATGNQFNVGTSLNGTGGTIPNLTAAMKASSDPNLSGAAYGVFTNAFNITYGTPGSNLHFDISHISGSPLGNSWSGSQTILPQTSTTNQVAQITGSGHVAHWGVTGTCTPSPCWTDLGAATVDIGPCDGNPLDAQNDVQTGCPQTNYPGLSPASNVPGCDPLTVIAGAFSGGCNGAPTPWTGTTRVINSGEQIPITAVLIITPNGSAGHADWRNSMIYGYDFRGNQTGSEILTGVTAVSLKDSTVRSVGNGFNVADVTNSVFFGNRAKWSSGDFWDRYSAHRTWIINNYSSDGTEPFLHIDCIQDAVSGTVAETVIYFSNATVDNECVQQTDNTNPFPPTWQTNTQTDSEWWGTYIANNIMYGNTNGILTGGRFNVVVQNDSFRTGIQLTYQAKAAQSQVNGFMANNVGNGIGRGSGMNAPQAGYCNAPPAGDMSTLNTNINIPFVPPGVGANAASYCTLAGAPLNNTTAGVFQGLWTWSQVDWRSQQAGVSSLFTDFDPVTWPASPPGTPGGGPGGGMWPGFDMFTCVNLSILPPQCPGGAVGVLNARPNTGFAATSQTIVDSVVSAQNLPNGVYADGSFAVAGSDGSGAGTGGVWEACSSCTTHVNGFTLNWQQVSTFYSPGLIGTGTALGLQAPIATHDGLAEPATPNVGAY
jgi:hypothetical protein